MIIIGLTGPIASGKNEVADYLRKKGFKYISLSEILREIAKKLGIKITRENLQNLGDELRRKFGRDFLARKAAERIKEGNWVINSIRNPGEVEFFRKVFKDFFLIAVDAPLEVRWERIRKRRKDTDPKSFEEFLRINRRDLGENQPEYGQKVKECMEIADFKILNNGSLKDLHKEVDEILERIYQKVFKEK